jgi:hypothetical protein
VAEPGDLTLGVMLRMSSPAEVFAAVCHGRPPKPPAGAEDGDGPGRARAMERWAARLGRVPTDFRLADW